jgi:hypothetical protein
VWIWWGCYIYVRDDLKYKILAKSNEIYTEDPEYIIIELNIKSKKVLFSVVYRPPTCSPIDVFANIIAEYVPQYDHVIITGDFNYNLLSECNKTTNFKSTIKSFNLNFLPLNPTHIHSAKSKPTLLDIFCTNNINKVLKLGQIAASIIHLIMT